MQLIKPRSLKNGQKLKNILANLSMCERLFLSSLASTFFALLFLTGTWAKIPVMRTTFWVELYSYADKQYSQTPTTLRIPEFSSLVYSDDRNSSVYSDNFDNN